MTPTEKDIIIDFLVKEADMMQQKANELLQGGDY